MPSNTTNITQRAGYSTPMLLRLGLICPGGGPLSRHELGGVCMQLSWRPRLSVALVLLHNRCCLRPFHGRGSQARRRQSNLQAGWTWGNCIEGGHGVCAFHLVTCLVYLAYKSIPLLDGEQLPGEFCPYQGFQTKGWSSGYAPPDRGSVFATLETGETD